MTFSFLC